MLAAGLMEMGVTETGDGANVGGGEGVGGTRVEVGIRLGEGEGCKVGVTVKSVASGEAGASASPVAKLKVGVGSMGRVGV